MGIQCNVVASRGLLGRFRQFLLCFAAVVGTSVHAVGVNTEPGDYVPAPAGTTVGLIYYQHLTADKVYSNGNQVVSNLGLSLDLALLRYVRFVKVGDWIANPQIVVPLAKQKIDLTGQRLSGVGDILVGGTLWPLYDWENNRHLGLTAMLSLPTGAHKSDGFAISPNRYFLNLQAGYVHGISKSWSLETSGQLELYGDQRETGASKRTYYQIDGAARYKLSDATSLGVTWRHGWGGRETLNGQILTGSERRDSLVLTWTSFVAPTVQLQAQWRQDFNVKDGPKIQGLQTRALFLF